jgi:HEPN superfamily Swt1-like protein
MEITQALKDTENALRDFIGFILQQKLGTEWIDKSGVSNDRIEIWKKRKKSEEKRQEAGVVEERLIYYADFFDLRTILQKNWQEFAPALGDWKTMDVWLGELEKLRDPEAHRRELLPHQKNLISGISGEIRNRLIRYRSKQETTQDYFPRIESVRDSLGSIWTPEEHTSYLPTKKVLRVGDTLDFVITANDPLGETLEYGFDNRRITNIQWQDHGTFSIRITEEDIGRYYTPRFCIRSRRKHHAFTNYDDSVEFYYSVLPDRDV